jgi:outer membrane protein OmpA-like peptidoglycan-associated protein
MGRDAAPDGAAAAALAAELGNRVHFDFDRAVLRPDDQTRLDRKAAILRCQTASTRPSTGHTRRPPGRQIAGTTSK